MLLIRYAAAIIALFMLFRFIAINIHARALC